MIRTRRRVGVAILSLLTALAGCSDDDVEFASTDAGNDAPTAETGADVTVDRSPDTGTPDTRPDVSTDPTVDPTPDTTGTDRTDARVDVGAETTPPTDAPDDTSDAADASDSADATSDAAADGDDGNRDAVSEEAGPPTCAERCASGVCDSSGNCTPCVKDDECMGGNVCNAGTCGPRCGDGGVACTGNLVCCSEHCVDTTRDPAHCGACGTTCSATQFCGNAASPVCKDNIVHNICNTKKATFLLDGLTDDDTSSGVIKNAITTLCVPAPTATSVSQSSSTAINTTTGEPLAGGGELLVAAGGDSFQLLVKYLESSGTSAIFNEPNQTGSVLQFKQRGADGGAASVLQTIPVSSLNATHDFFVVYVVKDPISGTFSLVVYGVQAPGTKAGAFYFANVMLPNIVGDAASMFTQAWYLYEWTGADAGGPGLSDTYTQIAAGL